MAVTVQSLKVHGDPRGFVFEPLDAPLLARQRNVHVVVTRPGAVRGNHYHLKGTETMAIEGPALVRIREDDEVLDMEVPSEQVYGFTFPPGVSHAIQNKGKEPKVLVAFNTLEHVPGESDTEEDVLI